MSKLDRCQTVKEFRIWCLSFKDDIFVWLHLHFRLLLLVVVVVVLVVVVVVVVLVLVVVILVVVIPWAVLSDWQLTSWKRRCGPLYLKSWSGFSTARRHITEQSRQKSPARKELRSGAVTLWFGLPAPREAACLQLRTLFQACPGEGCVIFFPDNRGITFVRNVGRISTKLHDVTCQKAGWRHGFCCGRR